MVKGFAISARVHPETEEQILEAIYVNQENPEIRGMLIGTASEIHKIYHVLKGWDYRYTYMVSPRAFEFYKSKGYKFCWAMESAPGKDLISARKPATLYKFREDQIWEDRYVSIKDPNQKMAIINFDKQTREIEGYEIIGRWDTSENTRYEFTSQHHLHPYAIHYTIEKLDWI